MTSVTYNTAEIVTEHSEAVPRIQFNRPDKKNALTTSMYTTVADLLNAANNDDGIRVALLHGAGDSFSAGNDLEDFLTNPPKPGQSAQERFVGALINFPKPLVAAVHGDGSRRWGRSRRSPQGVRPRHTARDPTEL